MQIKATISFDSATLAALDRWTGNSRQRSKLVEQAVRELLQRLERQRRDAQDLAILNAHAGALDGWVDDVIADQADDSGEP